MKRRALVSLSLLLVGAACGDGSSPASPAAPLPPPEGSDVPEPSVGSHAHRNAKSSLGNAVVGTALGANVEPGGVSFAVWAPHATRVFVTGDFNDWKLREHELVVAEDGVFRGHVAGAHAGQAYQYVIVNGMSTFLKADPHGRRMINSASASIIVDPDAMAWKTKDFTPPAFRDQVIYEMHLGTFAGATSDKPGTWAAATAKLDYLEGLGVNMLEVMPPAEFAGDYSWGYNTAYPFAVESAYGTDEDARRFVDEAHARGMGVIIDVVNNHWGPGDLGLDCFDGECLGAHGIYFYTDARVNTPWGPRPDFGRAEVVTFIRDSALMWVDEYRADGLRWDSTSNIRGANGVDTAEGWDLLRTVNNAFHAAGPGKIAIAEDLQNNPSLTEATATGGAGFDAQWDAGFFHPIDDTVITPLDQDRNMYAVRDAITHTYHGHAAERVIYTEDHDEVANGRQRIPAMITPNDPSSWFARKRSTLAAAIVMTSPGVPMIFQGQEFLEDGWFADTRPLDWAKTTRFDGIRRMYKDLISLRRNQGGTTAGLGGENVNVFHVNNTSKVIAFHRWNNGGPGDDVVVLANFSASSFPNYAIGFPRPGTWHVRFNGDETSYSSDFGSAPSSTTVVTADGARDGLAQGGSIAVAPYSVIILSQ